jgi:hypothetical protein
MVVPGAAAANAAARSNASCCALNRNGSSIMIKARTIQ